MRRARFLLAASSLAVTGVVMWASGCSSFYDDCVTNGLCGPFNPGAPKACPGDPTVDASLISDKCGLFVRADPAATDPGNGSRARPFTSIQAALDQVKDQWIFACSSTPFSEKVTITTNDVEIFGGFDCANGWAWSKDSRTTLKGLANLVALTVTGENAKVQNFRIEAADAITPGGSSIAVLVSAQRPTFTRCDMIAGKGKEGLPGNSIKPMQAEGGAAGNPGGAACTDEPVPGPGGPGNTCGTTRSVGGTGGNGTVLGGMSSDGSPGEPSGSAGQGGKGEPGGNANWCNDAGGAGKDGAPGAPGTPGSGATGDKIGALDGSGFYPANGSNGDPGKPGQGGGGGGGAKGGTQCTTTSKGGASGGSGGSGGCGGLGGNGGQGAGASIALVSIDSTEMTLAEVTLTAQDGVSGGAGGDAQKGGPGGPGGPGGSAGAFVGLNDACEGGLGGTGGAGGTGGGGRGGHSIGLAYTGAQPAIGANKVIFGKPGPGGSGGSMNFFNNSGDLGIAAATYAFPLRK